MENLRGWWLRGRAASVLCERLVAWPRPRGLGRPTARRSGPRRGPDGPNRASGPDRGASSPGPCGRGGLRTRGEGRATRRPPALVRLVVGAVAEVRGLDV